MPHLCNRVTYLDILILSCCGLLRLSLGGLWYSPGILFVAFRETMNTSSGLTSWITTLMYLTNTLMSALGGLFLKRFSCRLITIAGGIIMASGLITSMFATDISHIFVTYGIVSGIGSGLIYIGCIAALHNYVTRDRTLFFGICAFISNFGIVIYPPLLQFLIDKYSWRGMLLILGGIQLNTIPAAFLFSQKAQPTTESLTVADPADSNELQHLSERSRNIDHDDEYTREMKTTLNKSFSSNSETIQQLNSEEDLNTESSDKEKEFNKRDTLLDKRQEELEDQEILPETAKMMKEEREFYSCQKSLPPEEFPVTPEGNKICSKTPEMCSELAGDKEFLKDFHFYLYLLSAGLFYFGEVIVLGHLAAYTVMNTICTKMQASVLYTIHTGFMGAFKLFHGILSNNDRFNPALLHVLFCGLSGVTSFVLLFKAPYPLLCVYMAVLGTGIACIGGALGPTLVFKLTGTKGFEFGFGLFTLAGGIGYLFGAPFAGWLFDVTQSYTAPFLTAAITMILSSLSVVLLWRKSRVEIRRTKKSISKA